MMLPAIVTFLLVLASPVAACSVLPAAELDAQLRAVNAERRQAGLAPLLHADALSRVAQGHACDMARRRYFGHQDPSGRGVMDRLRAGNAGRVCWAAENLAMGQRDIRHVMRSWMGSAGHRANILNPRMTHIGFGRTSARHWVQVMIADCSGTSRG